MQRVIKRCPMCGAKTDVVVSKKGHAAWRKGVLIQNALPGLSATKREVLMTGLCSECQGDVLHD